MPAEVLNPISRGKKIPIKSLIYNAVFDILSIQIHIRYQFDFQEDAFLQLQSLFC